MAFNEHERLQLFETAERSMQLAQHIERSRRGGVPALRYRHFAADLSGVLEPSGHKRELRGNVQ